MQTPVFQFLLIFSHCHWTLLRRVWLHLHCTTHQVCIHMDKSPLNVLLSRLNSPSSLNVSLHKRCFSPLIISMPLSWPHSSMSCLSCTGESSTSPTGHSISGDEVKGRITSFNLPNAYQEGVGLTCCQSTLLAPDPLVHQYVHFLFCTYSFQSVAPSMNWCHQVQYLMFSFPWTSWDSYWLIYPLKAEQHDRIWIQMSFTSIK